MDEPLDNAFGVTTTSRRSAFGVRSFGTNCRTLAKFSFPCESLILRAFRREGIAVRFGSVERCANGRASRSLRHATAGNAIVTNNPSPPLAYRPRDAAKSLSISPRLLWQLTKDGQIPCVRIGNGKRQTVLYPLAVLQAWLNKTDSVNGGSNEPR